MWWVELNSCRGQSEPGICFPSFHQAVLACWTGARDQQGLTAFQLHGLSWPIPLTSWPSAAQFLGGAPYFWVSLTPRAVGVFSRIICISQLGDVIFLRILCLRR